ncbi:hypothetical protein [Butyrivibrio sp. AE2032]|uniref:hypothetical protein n=1 Tax=Butyrivibrio sp. AE2032 TaxID=1458463 RepID=UPI00163AD171|nr:hypothetical protein [Butyrivibrio sp. AE2032]
MELSNIAGNHISYCVFDYYLKEGEAMVKTKNTIKFMLKQYMLSNYIESFRDLAKETGIDYQTLLDHIARPELFRQWEIKVLDEVLKFNDEDLLKLIRG